MRACRSAPPRRFTGGASVDAAVTTTFGRDGGQDVAGHVGLRASF